MPIIEKNFTKVLILIFLSFYGFEAISDTQNTIEIKNPIFTTKGINGNPYEVKAEIGFQNEAHLDLFIIEAKLKTNENGWIYVQADKGSFYQSTGEINLEKNVIVYTEVDEKIFADLAKVNTNEKIITLINNVKYQDSNILITANKSIIDNELQNIKYFGNVKSIIIKRETNE